MRSRLCSLIQRWFTIALFVSLVVVFDTSAQSISPQGFWYTGYLSEEGHTGLSDIAIINCRDSFYGVVREWPTPVMFTVIAITPTSMSGTVYDEDGEISIGVWETFNVDELTYLVVAISYSVINDRLDPVVLLGVRAAAANWFHYNRVGC